MQNPDAAAAHGGDAGQRLGPRLVALMLGVCQAAGAPAADPGSFDQGRALFAEEMALKHGFDRAKLSALLGQARFRQGVIDAMERPYESKPWDAYRRLFVTPERIAGGLAFWRDNAELLERARSAYGVPAEVVVAILGVETNYGARIGAHRALDALATLGFSYPKRAAFFRGELESLLLLGRDERMDPLAALGSYAGALGKPQFIPSSYRAYAVDFDGDGRRDLWRSNADAIGSVANYFQRHGWRRGEPVTFPARLNLGPPEGIEVAGKDPLEPNTSTGQLRAAGVDWAGDLAADAPATLIRLDGPEAEYWLALNNFYVITRYNHSNLYAMAVHQLGGEIREAFDRGG